MSSCDYDSTISKAEMVLFHATKFCNPAANVLKNIKKAIDIYTTEKVMNYRNLKERSYDECYI